METLSASSGAETSSMTMMASIPLLSAHMSGASPTAYFCGEMVLRQMIQKGSIPNASTTTSEGGICKKDSLPSDIQTHVLPAVGKVDEMTGYAPLHLGAFLDANSFNVLLETALIQELNVQDRNGNTPLMWAVSEGREDIVQLLVDSGADVNIQNYAGETALILASSQGFNTVCCFLIENGAELNIASLDGASAAHLAAACGHTEVLITLANHGAYFNAQDDEGDTPLHYAIREGHDKIVHFLVEECNVQLDIENDDQESPLQLASCLEETKLVEYLTSASLSQRASTLKSSYELGMMVATSGMMLEEDDEHEGNCAQDQVQGNFMSIQWNTRRPCGSSGNTAAKTVLVRM